MMKNLKKYLLFTSLLSLGILFNSCEEDFEKVYPPSGVDFLKESVELELEDGDTYQIPLEATAPTDMDRTFTIMVEMDGTDADEAMYQYPATITIPAGETIGYGEMTFDHSLLEFGDPRTVEFSFNAGEELVNVTRPTTKINFVKKCTLNDVEIVITTDDWPDETTWEVYDLAVSTTDPIAEGGPYDGQDFSDISSRLCLDTGGYALVVYDSYGDGIVGGGYVIKVNEVEVASGGVAGSYAVEYFDIP